MAILGIKNRTENWKTATHFVPLAGESRVRLIDLLLETASSFRPAEIGMELFWRGMRDHFDGSRKELERHEDLLAEHYVDLFPHLRGSIEDSVAPGGIRPLKEWNYDASTRCRQSHLASNLFNTEIDIVLETPEHLFIGEAKHKTSFHAHSALILTHQLIRQYVMASVLVRLQEKTKVVVPFVVGDKAPVIAETAQVRFMIDREYMRPENVLGWRAIEALR